MFEKLFSFLKMFSDPQSLSDIAIPRRMSHGNRGNSHTKSGPGRYHVQGAGRKQTSMKYPGTHRSKK